MLRQIPNRNVAVLTIVCSELSLLRKSRQTKVQANEVCTMMMMITFLLAKCYQRATVRLRRLLVLYFNLVAPAICCLFFLHVLGK